MLHSATAPKPNLPLCVHAGGKWKACADAEYKSTKYKAQAANQAWRSGPSLRERGDATQGGPPPTPLICHWSYLIACPGEAKSTEPCQDQDLTKKKRADGATWNMRRHLEFYCCWCNIPLEQLLLQWIMWMAHVLLYMVPSSILISTHLVQSLWGSMLNMTVSDLWYPGWSRLYWLCPTKLGMEHPVDCSLHPSLWRYQVLVIFLWKKWHGYHLTGQAWDHGHLQPWSKERYYYLCTIITANKCLTSLSPSCALILLLMRAFMQPAKICGRHILLVSLCWFSATPSRAANVGC